MAATDKGALGLAQFSKQYLASVHALVIAAEGFPCVAGNGDAELDYVEGVYCAPSGWDVHNSCSGAMFARRSAK